MRIAKGLVVRFHGIPGTATGIVDRPTHVADIAGIEAIVKRGGMPVSGVEGILADQYGLIGQIEFRASPFPGREIRLLPVVIVDLIEIQIGLAEAGGGQKRAVTVTIAALV